jgi:hypothetical protein
MSWISGTLLYLLCNKVHVSVLPNHRQAVHTVLNEGKNVNITSIYILLVKCLTFLQLLTVKELFLSSLHCESMEPPYYKVIRNHF